MSLWLQCPSTHCDWYGGMHAKYGPSRAQFGRDCCLRWQMPFKQRPKKAEPRWSKQVYVGMNTADTETNYCSDTRSERNKSRMWKHVLAIKTMTNFDTSVYYTRGYPSLRENARLSFAHALNTEDLRYVLYVKNWRWKCASIAKGYIEIKRVWMKRKKTLE